MATWNNHYLFNAAAAYFIGFSPIEIGVITITGHINDILDSIFSRKKIKYKNEYIKAHRFVFHDISIWIILGILLYFFKNYIYIKNIIFHPYTIIIGPILHILLDYCTPYGVYFFSKRRSLNLFKTGSINEYFYTLILISIFILLKFKFSISLFNLINLLINRFYLLF